MQRRSPVTTAAPRGLRAVRAGRVLVLVGPDADPVLEAALLAPPTAAPRAEVAGRRPLRTVTLAEGRALLRVYRHGGLLGGLTGPWLLGPGRALREVHLTREARRRGVPTVEVLGLRLERGPAGLYRALLATREVAGAADAAVCLRADQSPAPAVRRALAAAAGRAVGLLHRAGIQHRDLNLRNLLLRPGPVPAAFVIDLDKGRLLPAPLDRRRSLANLRRLDRSVQKLVLLGRIAVGRTDRLRFLRAYLAAHPLGLPLRAVVRRTRRRYPLRRLRWRLARRRAKERPWN